MFAHRFAPVEAPGRPILSGVYILARHEAFVPTGYLSANHTARANPKLRTSPFADNLNRLPM